MTVGNFLAIVSKRSVLIGFVTHFSVEIPEIVSTKVTRPRPVSTSWAKSGPKLADLGGFCVELPNIRTSAIQW